MVDIRRKCLGP